MNKASDASQVEGCVAVQSDFASRGSFAYELAKGDLQDRKDTRKMMRLQAGVAASFLAGVSAFLVEVIVDNGAQLGSLNQCLSAITGLVALVTLFGLISVTVPRDVKEGLELTTLAKWLEADMAELGSSGIADYRAEVALTISGGQGDRLLAESKSANRLRNSLWGVVLVVALLLVILFSGPG